MNITLDCYNKNHIHCIAIGLRENFNLKCIDRSTHYQINSSFKFKNYFNVKGIIKLKRILLIQEIHEDIFRFFPIFISEVYI